MLGIRATNLGKSYSGKFLFRNMNFFVAPGSHSVVLGPNGSGKSTLLQILAGYGNPTEGKVQLELPESHPLNPEKWYKNLSISAPYLDLFEELSFTELIHLQSQTKPFLPGLSGTDIIQISGLYAHADRPVRFFSSGMKQRLKNTLAVLSDVPLILLDEPCSNLDAISVDWYQNLLRQYVETRTILVFSNNRKEEYPGFSGEIVLCP